MRLNKNIKFFLNYFFGPLLFAWLCISIYQQVRNQSQVEATWLHLKESLFTGKGGYLALAVVLMLVNWGLETIKWQLAIAPIYQLRFWQAFKAVLSGVSFSVTTPNRTGEYIGRMLYMPEGKRLKVIAVTLISSCSQLLVTLLLGTISLIYLKSELIRAWPSLAFWHSYIAIGFISGLFILTLLYYKLPQLEQKAERLLKHSSYLYLIEAIRDYSMQRLAALLLLSLTRFCVFVIQYILLFYLFEVYVPALTLFWIMSLVFLALAIIPSITLVEIGVRGEVSLLLVGLYTTNSLGVLLTSVSIWLINLIIPAVAGSILILGVRVFRKRNEKRQIRRRQQAEVL
jgi:MFS family permease